MDTEIMPDENQYTSDELEQIANDVTQHPMSVTSYVGLLVDENPNDSDLGAKVRELIGQLRNPG
jgi:hypothetical protein